MKIKIVGRPGKVIQQGPFFITSMLAPQKSPTLPKGLPPLPPSKLVYLVYIAQKQWKKVAEAIKNPEDILILEGWLSYDKELKRMSIFTQSATTKMLELYF